MTTPAITPAFCRRITLHSLLARWVWLLVVMPGVPASVAESAADTSVSDRAVKKRFDIPAGDAFTTFKRFSAQSGEQLIYKADSIEGVKTDAVRGRFTPQEALSRMLVRTKLAVTQDVATGTLAITRTTKAGGPNGSAGGDSGLDSAAKKKESPNP